MVAPVVCGRRWQGNRQRPANVIRPVACLDGHIDVDSVGLDQHVRIVHVVVLRRVQVDDPAECEGILNRRNECQTLRVGSGGRDNQPYVNVSATLAVRNTSSKAVYYM